MGGLLTHLSIAFVGFLVGTFIFKNYKYGLAFVFGHIIPDVIDFGVIGLFTGSVNPVEIMMNPWFGPLVVLGHTLWHWVFLGLIIFIIIFLLYKFNKISKKKFVLFLVILIFFLAGVGVHLLIDKLIIETNYWI